MKTLDDLKPGDQVIYSSRNLSDHIVTVDRVTKTMIVVNGLRFSKKNGHIVSSDIWNYSHIDAIDPDDVRIKILKHESEIRKIKKIVIDYLEKNSGSECIELYRAIAFLISEHEKGKSKNG